MSVGVTPSYTTEEPIAATGDGEATPLERLANDDLHQQVLERLTKRLAASERKMSQFYARWQANEARFQAYLAAKDLEAIRKASNEKGTPPEIVTITVPYSYSTIMTIVTYLQHTFCGHKPIFPVAAHRPDFVQRSQKVETLLQYNADHERIIRKFYQFFMDGEMYGLQIMRCLWKSEERRKTVWQDVANPLMPGLPQRARMTKPEVMFEGNELLNIDPFNFFPDPNVPMDEVNKRGEFVFWKHYEGKHVLRKAQKAGLIAYVEKIESRSVATGIRGGSDRGRLAEGDGHAGTFRSDPYSTGDVYELVQGTVDLVPSEWGLGPSAEQEKYLFTWANGNRIIQCEPLDADHDRHPVIVGEPYSAGYGFGNIAAADMLGPMQDTLSWLVNSHMFNVRAVLNNTLIVNPQMIDMNDLKKPGPGRVIKMLPAAFGQNPQNAVAQLPIQDVTRTHIQDMQVVTRLADMISATNDNLRGIQSAGGRKTATEVRTGNEAGASRLAAHAVLISSQSVMPLAEMMTMNYQQNLTMDFYLKALGTEAAQDFIKIDPEGIAGDFYYPIHDGTMPMDKMALLEVWKEILVAMMQAPPIAQGYNVPQIFEYVAKLGGAKNITQFRIQAAPDGMMAQQAQAGNAVPLGPLGPPNGSGAPLQ